MAEEQLARAQIATNERNVEVLEKSLQEEKQKLLTLNGSKGTEKESAKFQKEFKEHEITIAELSKERDWIKQKQAKFRSELEALNNREEFLYKEKNATVVMESRLKNQLEEIFENAKLHQTIDSIDLSQSDIAKTLSNLKNLLKEKTELEDDDIQSANLKQLETEYSKKMKDLQLKEEQFN